MKREKVYDDHPISEDVPEHYRELYPKRHLQPHDLNGQKVIVTIDRLEKEEHFIPSSNKWRVSWVAYFTKGHKYLIINQGIAESLAKATGTPNPTEWPKKRIAIMAGQMSENNGHSFTIKKAPPIPTTEGKTNGTDTGQNTPTSDTPEEPNN